LGKADKAEPSGPLNRRQFTEYYLAMLAEQAPELKAERVGDDVHLRWADGGTMTQFLGNAYAQYRNDPDALKPVLQAQLASARATTAMQQTLDLDLVLPLIKSQGWLATAVAQSGNAADFVIRPLVSDLIVVFAQDLPDTIAYVKRHDLEGVCGEEQLVARAMSNLTSRLSGLDVIGSEGRYRIELDGFFDTSLLLVAADWIKQLDLDGDPVFALPCRDQLMVCGSANTQAVEELAEITPQIAQSDAYDISRELLILRDGVLQTLRG
jgi:hypothetical protein